MISEMKIGGGFRPVAPSEAKILSIVFRMKKITQPDIVRDSELSQQTVSRIVNSLVEESFLRIGEKQSSGKRGQPSYEVEINSAFAYSIGVALMTDALSVLLMDFSGRVINYQYRKMESMSRTSVFAAVANGISVIISNFPLVAGRIAGIGVGISGYCLDGKSRFNPPQALEEWAMIPIDTAFQEEFNLPVWVENDGSAAAIGESFLGAGRKYRNFVYIFVAAGLGGGVINQHRLVRGAHGNGGEVGLMIPWDRYDLPTLETLLASIKAAGGGVASISEMLEQFDVTWPGVDAWLEQSSHSLSLISSGISALLDPEAIVFGGRIPKELTGKIIPKITIFDDARRREPRPLPKLIASETTVDACAIGAAMIPLERSFFSQIW